MSVVASITKCMIAYPGSTRHDIAHLLKVWAYAKAIGELEVLDAQTQLILEIAALTHDIACPLCRQKYGSAAGNLQEIESPTLLEAFFKHSDIGDKVKVEIIKIGEKGIDLRLLEKMD